MDKYPLPAHAAYVWIAGDKLFLGLPGEGTGHTIQLDTDSKGLSVLLSVLRERAHTAARTVGTRSAPTQHDYERLRAMGNAVLKQGREARLAKQRRDRAEAEAGRTRATEDLIKELGL